MRRTLTVVVSVIAMVVIVVMMVGMIVIMMMRMVMIVTLDLGFPFATSANSTHHSTSSSLIFISSPPVTCNW